jgi:hypothetical protein
MDTGFRKTVIEDGATLDSTHHVRHHDPHRNDRQPNPARR